ncbi:MAG: hypothetical protein JSU74_01215 [Candidatus Zixiibacteriota bacterium]|nr:MAG: hypothetical protein JSU74_01215 [candidate division Zixibacteria bacterium]
MRKRHEKGKHSHYCILVNRSAAGYSKVCVSKLIGEIRRKGSYYTVFEPDSATQLYQTAQRACGLRRWHRGAPQQFSRRGKVTSLIACGGDGTVNLVARVALKANLPMGIVPTGKLNNIAMSLYGKSDPERAISKAVGRNYRKIDTAVAAGQLFIGSAGLGLACSMTELLNGRRQPRFCLGWSGLASKAAAAVDLKKVVIKIDAFRFEARPIIMNVNLLPYSFGLPLSPISVSDDRTAEVIFNLGIDTEPFSTFIRQVCRRKYIYGSSVKLFRGRDIGLESVKGQVLYYDGELMSLNQDRLDVKIGTSQLKVYC